MAKPTTRKEFKEYCLDNKYSKWYFSIIENALIRGWNKNIVDFYTENHHIIPKSICENNEIVCLTAREHFICHLLLTKILKNEDKNKMYAAIKGMKRSNKNQYRYINARLYDKLKGKYKHTSETIKKFSDKLRGKSKNLSEENIQKLSERAKQTFTGRKHSEETKKKMSECRKNKIKNDENFYKKLCVHLLEIRPIFVGKNNSMYGKRGKLSPHYNKSKTEEHKLKIKKALTGMKYTKERCEKMSVNCPKNSLGKKWYHDPITKIEKYFIEGTQPVNFIKGRLGVSNETSY